MRDYQLSIVDDVCNALDAGETRIMLALSTGAGKCLGYGTPVLMHDGSIKPVQEVVRGDLLMGADSTPRNVLSITSGREQLYRIKPVKGDSYVVNESHILSLRMTDTGKVVNISVREYLATNNDFKHKAKGWRTGVEFPRKEVPIPPYVLGVWLGDGDHGRPAITSSDPEVVSAWCAYGGAVGLPPKVTYQRGNCTTYRLTGGMRGGAVNPITAELRQLGVLDFKHVPVLYKTNAREIRLEILAGILDTDGHLQNNYYDLTLKQKQFADDVAYLARSLGLAAYVKQCRKGIRERGFEGDYYRVTISGHVSMIPCRVRRKRASERRQIKNVLNTGITVEPLGVGDYYGFEIDGDRLFLLGDFTVTHNTHIARDLIRRLGGPDRQVLFVVDRLVLVEQAVNVFRNHGFHVGVIQAENSRYSSHDDVIVASVQSLPTREVPRGISLIFIDEAHLLHKPHIELLEHPPQTEIFPGEGQMPIIGLSATPLRKGLSEYFNLLLRGPCIRELTEARFLVPVQAYSPGREQLTLALASVTVTGGDYQAAELSRLFRRDVVIGDAVATYQQRGEKRPAIAFCVDQAHARAVTAEFEAVGISTACILSDTSLSERKAIVADFEAGGVQVLVSVAVLSAGFDAPHASCAILLRPTLSRSLHIQQVGRVLRSLRDSNDNELTDDDGNPVKQDALILDHAGNCTRHGLPEDFIVPELSDETHLSVSSLRKLVDRLDSCGNCCLVMPEGAEFCPACGADRPVRRSNVEYLDGDLLEHHQAAEAERAECKRIQTVPATVEEKKAWYLGYRFYCRAHGRKEGEAFHAYKAKFKEKPPWSWKSMDVVPPSPDVLRYAQHRNIAYFKGKERAGRKGKQRRGVKPSKGGSGECES